MFVFYLIRIYGTSLYSHSTWYIIKPSFADRVTPGLRHWYCKIIRINQWVPLSVKWREKLWHTKIWYMWAVDSCKMYIAILQDCMAEITIYFSFYIKLKQIYDPEFMVRGDLYIYEGHQHCLYICMYVYITCYRNAYWDCNFIWNIYVFIHLLVKMEFVPNIYQIYCGKKQYTCEDSYGSLIISPLQPWNSIQMQYLPGILLTSNLILVEFTA